jgi:hypothetical protein
MACRRLSWATVRNRVQDLFGEQPGASDWLVVDTTGNPAGSDGDVSDWTGSAAGAYRDRASQWKAAVGGIAQGAETLAPVTGAAGMLVAGARDDGHRREQGMRA